MDREIEIMSTDNESNIREYKIANTLVLLFEEEMR